MALDSSDAAILATLETEAAWFLALLLAGASLHKLFAPTRARRVAGDLLGWSRRGAAVAAATATATEGVAAACLIEASSRGVGALIAAALWALYLGLIGRAIIQGRRDLDCGCSFGRAHRPLGRWQLLRTACLCVLAAAVAGLAWDPGVHGAAIAAGSGPAGSGPAGFASEVLAALALLALYAALDHVLALAPLRAGALR
jgi:hypothetical protein